MHVDINPAHFPAAEERINVATHAAGLLLSVAGLVALVALALRHGDTWHLVSFSIYGASLVVLFAASTAYHSSRAAVRRARLRTADHASIYLLIAGTYTPFALVTLSGPVGWALFGITWGMAVAGIVLKLLYTGRFNHLSTGVYVFMGWLVVFFIKPLIDSFPPAGLAWLVAGGIIYTLGAVLYSIERLPFNHALFHLFVLLGAACHFVAIYGYVLAGDSLTGFAG
ncbi:MAG: PAQR family membrane homeostasis protein TrhA [Lysobacterales bacterium]